MSKKKKKFTVPEFKTWLEGIMQFQQDDWSPNREQWDEIYEKIMDLKEPVNKEKMSLTDPALDEIAEIVRYNVDEGLNDFAPKLMAGFGNRPAQAPQGPQQYPQNDQGNDVWQNIGGGGQTPQNPPSAPNAPTGGLENKSLSDLRREYESAQGNLSTQPGGEFSGTSSGSASGGRHKLPDRADDASIPDDYV